MLRHTVALFALLIATSAAEAATLSVTPDKASYEVGETITLSIVGDSQGAGDIAAFGFLRFDTSLASWQSTTEVPLTSFGGAVVWAIGYAGSHCMGGTTANPGCPVFDQISGIVNGGIAPIQVDNLLLSTVKLTALAPGLLDFTWETNRATSWPLHFFGLTNAPGTSVLIHNPEPGTAALLALGLIALARSRRSR